MYELTQNKVENTLNLMTVPNLADTVAVTVGNAYLIPSDEDNADKPWKTFKMDIDGQDCIFICKDSDEPKHVQHIVPADTFTADGVRYLFRFDPPPADFCRMLASQGQIGLLLANDGYDVLQEYDEESTLPRQWQGFTITAQK